jgi:hypothetical protein
MDVATVNVATVQACLLVLRRLVQVRSDDDHGLLMRPMRRSTADTRVWPLKCGCLPTAEQQ